MKKYLLLGIAVTNLLFGVTDTTTASQIGDGYHHIGYAYHLEERYGYSNSQYMPIVDTILIKSRLILEKGSNGKSLIWLDYDLGPDLYHPSIGNFRDPPVYLGVNWYYAMNWAENLQMNINNAGGIDLLPGYRISWDDESWRLPQIGAYNYNPGNNPITSTCWPPNSELLSLSRNKFLGISGQYYWSGNTHPMAPGFAWDLILGGGGVHTSYYKYFCPFTGASDQGSPFHYFDRAVGVRAGQVSIVPEPATILLLSLGLLWFAGVNRKKI